MTLTNHTIYHQIYNQKSKNRSLKRFTYFNHELCSLTPWGRKWSYIKISARNRQMRVDSGIGRRSSILTHEMVKGAPNVVLTGEWLEAA